MIEGLRTGVESRGHMQELVGRSLHNCLVLWIGAISSSLSFPCFDVVYYITRPCCLGFAGQFCLSHCSLATSTGRNRDPIKG